MAVPPWSAMIPATRSAPATLTSASTTVMPAWAKPIEIASPRPLPAPVTTATRPVRSKMSRA